MGTWTEESWGKGVPRGRSSPFSIFITIRKTKNSIKSTLSLIVLVKPIKNFQTNVGIHPSLSSSLLQIYHYELMYMIDSILLRTWLQSTFVFDYILLQWGQLWFRLDHDWEYSCFETHVKFDVSLFILISGLFVDFDIKFWELSGSFVPILIAR